MNDELETMKQLLKEIVKRITDNLLGKSSNSSETGRQSRLTRDGSHSVGIKNDRLIYLLNLRVNYPFDLLCAIMLISWILIKKYSMQQIQKFRREELKPNHCNQDLGNRKNKSLSCVSI